MTMRRITPLKVVSRKVECFKLQRPLNVAGSIPMVLIYNEDRSQYGEIPITKEIIQLMGDSFKIYVSGFIDSNGMLHIEEKVGRQGW